MELFLCLFFLINNETVSNLPSKTGEHKMKL